MILSSTHYSTYYQPLKPLPLNTTYIKNNSEAFAIVTYFTTRHSKASDSLRFCARLMSPSPRPLTALLHAREGGVNGRGIVVSCPRACVLHVKGSRVTCLVYGNCSMVYDLLGNWNGLSERKFKSSFIHYVQA